MAPYHPIFEPFQLMHLLSCTNTLSNKHLRPVRLHAAAEDNVPGAPGP